MKFRKVVLFFILGILIILFFTKPTEKDFLTYIQPLVSRTHVPPVIEYQDKFLYVQIIVTFVDTKNLIISKSNRSIAPARREKYIGIFKRYWQQNS